MFLFFEHLWHHERWLIKCRSSAVQVGFPKVLSSPWCSTMALWTFAILVLNVSFESIDGVWQGFEHAACSKASLMTSFQCRRSIQRTPRQGFSGNVMPSICSTAQSNCWTSNIQPTTFCRGLLGRVGQVLVIRTQSKPGVSQQMSPLYECSQLLTSSAVQMWTLYSWKEPKVQLFLEPGTVIVPSFNA